VEGSFGTGALNVESEGSRLEGTEVSAHDLSPLKDQTWSILRES
jgi:hypothetical protein